jgi:hypothetical protein
MFSLNSIPMQILELNLYNKSTWADGEWKTEPDKIQWLDEKTEYPCLIRRVLKIGVLCGYVGVNKSHPLYESYDAWGAPLKVHGGINFATKCTDHICHVVEEGEDDDVWWLGFSCNESSDLAPIDLAEKHGWKCPPHLKDVELRISQALGKEYRNVAYVKEQCASLAMQLKELDNVG